MPTYKLLFPWSLVGAPNYLNLKSLGKFMLPVYLNIRRGVVNNVVRTAKYGAKLLNFEIRIGEIFDYYIACILKP